MTQTSPGEITRLLPNVSSPETFSKLFGLAYGELRKIAKSLFRRERPDHTLQPTALVHICYLKLLENRPKRFESRNEFFGIASWQMRQILIDDFRRHSALKRAGNLQKVPLHDLQVAAPESSDLIVIKEAVAHLKKVNAELGEIAELKLFKELSSDRIGERLHLAPGTVRKKWGLAHAWLQRALTEDSHDPRTLA